VPIKQAGYKVKEGKTMNSIIKTDIRQNGKRIGFIVLKMPLCNYKIELYLHGISKPVEIQETSDYYNALHIMRILENKYSY
jgi:hypothetical protein